MNQQIFESLLACPRCKNPLQISKFRGKCKKCRKTYLRKNGIWHLLYQTSDESFVSRKLYDSLFSQSFGGPKDGSYEILGSFATGNRTADIACGVGIIEKLSSQTIGVDFSLPALKIARKNGAKYLILADAHALPFKNNAFGMAISAGNLEHFESPELAVFEMARISKIQIWLVHKYPPLPFMSYFFHKLCRLLNIKLQPIENPLTKSRLKKFFNKAGLHIVFDGVWTLPVNYGRVVKFLPEFHFLPSSYFFVSIKTYEEK